MVNQDRSWIQHGLTVNATVNAAEMLAGAVLPNFRNEKSKKTHFLAFLIAKSSEYRACQHFRSVNCSDFRSVNCSVYCSVN